MTTPIITHCEDTPMIDAAMAEARARWGDGIPASAHPDIRSREACIKSTRLALSLARKHGTRLHVLHISTADELALFELRHGQPQDVARFRGSLRHGSGIGSALQRTGGGQHGLQGGLAVGLAGCGLHEVGPVTDAPLLLGG